MSEPDVVDAMSALLDLWDEAVASGREANAPAIRSLLGEARDEIVALRDERETLWGVAFDYVRIRAEALEEAAQICERHWAVEGDNMAAALRAWKASGDDVQAMKRTGIISAEAREVAEQIRALKE